MVHTPKEFSDMKFVPSIITVYLPRLDEIVEPESIHQTPSIPKTLSIHKYVPQINDRGDCNMQFYKMVVDQEAFHTQWYNKASDVVCGHEKFNKNSTKWLRCPIREQWLHEISLNLIFNLVSDGKNVFFISLI